MTVLANLKANAAVKSGSPLANWLTAEQAARSVDPAVPTASALTNAVTSQATSTQTSGNFTLTVTIRQASGVVESFTTGNIAFNAAASAVETAIDSAATSASITGWTNGDISVSGGAVNAAPVVCTFDGASVTGKVCTVTLNDVDGAGGAWGAVTQTTNGQPRRDALGVLLAFDVITSALPVPGAAASSGGITAGTNPNRLVPLSIVKELAAAAAVEENNNGLYHDLEAALFSQDRAPLIESRVLSDN